MAGQARPWMLRANNIPSESGPSMLLQGLIKPPSHIPGIWTDLIVPQVEGNGQPPHFFQQLQQDKVLLSYPPPVQSVSIYLGWQDQLRPNPKLRSIPSPNFLYPFFYLRALAGRTLRGVEPGNAWCGKCRRESGSLSWYLQSASQCFQMLSSGAGTWVRSGAQED